MKFSTKSRYAIRLMIDIAQQQPKKVSLKEISERQAISLKYLEQIVNPLVKSGLLRSERGSQGGYTLAKEIKEYSIGEIIRIFEGGLMPIPCIEIQPNTCPRYQKCPTVHFWEGLGKVINDYVDSVSLQDLCTETKKEVLDVFFKQLAQYNNDSDGECSSDDDCK
ncbi:MAG: Rrf2 family transcriptional regulator [Lachnospiraceae bacterium]|jgi:Rrf2 family protein|nr:Rrf2 family transcriptional regulator [Lachnospiraceae bacterium]MCR4555145.1 Rrf2 family transcriptional regulator [Succinivibrionaceae bacterium]